jgi:hypothetical protein
MGLKEMESSNRQTEACKIRYKIRDLAVKYETEKKSRCRLRSGIRTV